MTAAPPVFLEGAMATAEETLRDAVAAWIEEQTGKSLNPQQLDRLLAKARDFINGLSGAENPVIRTRKVTHSATGAEGYIGGGISRTLEGDTYVSKTLVLWTDGTKSWEDLEDLS